MRRRLQNTFNLSKVLEKRNIILQYKNSLVFQSKCLFYTGIMTHRKIQFRNVKVLYTIGSWKIIGIEKNVVQRSPKSVLERKYTRIKDSDSVELLHKFRSTFLVFHKMNTIYMVEIFFPVYHCFFLIDFHLSNSSSFVQ